MNGFEKRSQMKKKAILEKAFELFNQYGYKNVTMAKISKEANVSLGAIYSYFESKENIKKDFLNKIIDDFCILTENILKSDLPVKTKFEKLLISKVDFAQQFSSNFLTEEFHQLNDLSLLGGIEKKHILHNIVDQIIEQGRKGNVITVDVSSEALTSYIEIFQYYITHNFSSALQISANADLLKEIYYLFFNGLQAKNE